MLRKHIDHEHAEEGSRTSLTLQSVEDNSDWIYAHCSLCGKRLQSESEMEFHIQRFHEYADECALYRCEFCGYRGQDIPAMQDHLFVYHENPEKTLFDI